MSLLFHNVQTQQDLDHAYSALIGQTSLALDTEFMRQNTYFPQIALIQVGVLQDAWLVDPLTELFDWPRVRSLLKQEKVTKIIHAPQQDFEALAIYDAVPTGPFWDTQTAAMFCGHLQHLGYEALVHHYLKVELEKNEQRSLWDRRPLRPEQQTYAARDVIYLHDLKDALEKDLKTWGRLEWFQEDMAFLDQRPFYGDQKIFALKPEWVASNPALHVFYTIVHRLFEWRESRARALNKPRTFLWDNKVLMDVAEWALKTHDRSAVPLKVTPYLRRHWGDLRSLLEDIPLGYADASYSVYEASQHNRHESLIKKLRKKVHHETELLKIPNALLATRDELKRFAYGEDDVRFLKGWRYAYLGETALAWRTDMER